VRAVTFPNAPISEPVPRNETGLGKEGADAKSPENAANRVGAAPLPPSGPNDAPALGVEGGSAILHELILFSSSADWNCTLGSRFKLAYCPKRLSQRPGVESSLRPDRIQEDPGILAHPCTRGKRELMEKKEEDVLSNYAHTLFQELFFFCTIKNVGDVPGMGCIYVETVVDRDSGIAFAKVYSGRNAMNAVDILASRVVPFFERKGVAIGSIHTRKTSEYCGFPPVHPFETFLATSHIQHLRIDKSAQSDKYLCEQFYCYLLKEFFPAALRRTFRLSLDELQKELDAFVEAYNTMQIKHKNGMKSKPHPSANFPVDL
jgi:hypothetical protein